MIPPLFSFRCVNKQPRLFSGNFELSILRQGAPPIAAIGNPPISDFIITTERSNGLFFDQTVVFRYQIENMCFFAPFIACILNIPRDSCAASAFITTATDINKHSQIAVQVGHLQVERSSKISPSGCVNGIQESLKQFLRRAVSQIPAWETVERICGPENLLI